MPDLSRFVAIDGPARACGRKERTSNHGYLADPRQRDERNTSRRPIRDAVLMLPFNDIGDILREQPKIRMYLVMFRYVVISVFW